ncbi:MAG: hypothetical protein LBS68_02930 [Puniceicoccales bacterium]|jgi:hypothetical protein|nr:hypothetical protein [Puniceicoccales bacterium]
MVGATLLIPLKAIAAVSLVVLNYAWLPITLIFWGARVLCGNRIQENGQAKLALYWIGLWPLYCLEIVLDHFVVDGTKRSWIKAIPWTNKADFTLNEN